MESETVELKKSTAQLEWALKAVCHRDYESTANIQIRVFDDRIEIWGCGPLPEPLTPDDLMRRHKSILRNPLIAKCFFLIRYIEQWGTGTNRMIDKCKEYQGLFDVSRNTASKDLNRLVEKGIVKRAGEGKRSIRYLLK
jgi:ATP-dependent DNA helicase RecG